MSRYPRLSPPVHRVSVGTTGRQTNFAYGRTSTWNVPATVTQQLLIESTEGFDAKPEMPDDESFTQDYIGMTEPGDNTPITPELKMRLRFEQGPDVFIAAAVGSPAAPVVVSSQAATSLVAYTHAITMAPEIAGMFTGAMDMVNYVQETRSFKVSGIKINVGANGRLVAAFPIVGDKTVYDSTVNVAASIAGATVATPGNAAWRRTTRIRMNMQAAGALGASDELNNVKEFAFNFNRPLAQDLVCNSDSIIEPDDDGWLEGTVEFTYARMNSNPANSLVVALAAGGTFKADIFMQGPYINSYTRRSMLWEMPALQFQPAGYQAAVVGHGIVRPKATFKLKMADAAPTGMTALTNPLRVTIVNARSSNLLA